MSDTNFTDQDGCGRGNGNFGSRTTASETGDPNICGRDEALLEHSCSQGFGFPHRQRKHRRNRKRPPAQSRAFSCWFQTSAWQWPEDTEPNPATPLALPGAQRVVEEIGLLIPAVIGTRVALDGVAHGTDRIGALVEKAGGKLVWNPGGQLSGGHIGVT